jgi:hypothetical protein
MSDHFAGPQAAARPGVDQRLVLTYDNEAQTDGVGSQLQRIYGTYAISRLLGVPYVHSPLASVDYQGLAALEENESDPGFHHEFNSLFQIESDVVLTDECFNLNLRDVSAEMFHQLLAIVDRDETRGRSYLVRLAAPHRIADRFPDCYEVCRGISPFASPARDGRPLRVAVHVRRGELFVVDSDRMLPNAYYIGVAQKLAHVLEALEIDYEIELSTEVPKGEFVVEPHHHGMSGRVHGPIAVSPEMYRLDEFSVLPKLVRCINERAIDCIRKLATADVLVMSRSSFSYLGAILNRNGIVLYHPFWHSAPSSWVTVDSDGQFDEMQFTESVKAL